MKRKYEGKAKLSKNIVLAITTEVEFDSTEMTIKEVEAELKKEIAEKMTKDSNSKRYFSANDIKLKLIT